MFSRWSRPHPGPESETRLLSIEVFLRSAPHLPPDRLQCSFSTSLPTPHPRPAPRSGCVRVGGIRSSPLPALCVSHFGCGCLLGSVCPRLSCTPSVRLEELHRCLRTECNEPVPSAASVPWAEVGGTPVGNPAAGRGVCKSQRIRSRTPPSSPELPQIQAAFPKLLSRAPGLVSLTAWGEAAVQGTQ